ncbi:hypothetical protein QUB80_12835 [Chlorogloeopsis sp. ULAP01]|nr:hypothetical protein [Chlorogloeopsis sp. ULAP01]
MWKHISDLVFGWFLFIVPIDRTCMNHTPKKCDRTATTIIFCIAQTLEGLGYKN